jgi:hypothetical protein
MLCRRRALEKALASTSRSACALLLLLALTPAGGAAQSDGQARELDEVAVVGKKLRQLRREAIAAEDRFYERFNTLNTRDDFDILCQMDKATGTIVPKRLCRVRFLVDAGAMDGQEFFRGLTFGSGARGVNTPLARLQPLWLQRREEYRQTVRSLLESDAELARLASEWVRLKEQYERVRDERHDSGLIQF